MGVKGIMRGLKVGTRGLNLINTTQRIKERVRIKKETGIVVLIIKKKIEMAITERSIGMVETIWTGDKIIRVKTKADKVRKIVLGITMQAEVKVERVVTFMTKELHKVLLQGIERNLSPKPKRGDIKILMAKVQNTKTRNLS